MKHQEEVAKVRKKFKEFTENYSIPESSACLIWTLAVLETIEDTKLQAGTCLWQFLSPKHDTGKGSTHFGYEWDPTHPLSLRAMKEGRMPEMHVWAAIPERRIIIDMTTGFFPEQCKNIIGANWTHTRPPLFFWDTVDNLPHNTVYRPVPEAMLIAFYLATHYSVDLFQSINQSHVGRMLRIC